MKVEERKKARELRRRGKSIREIEKELKVSRGSVSMWVRDVKLTKKQKRLLTNRSLGQIKATQENMKKFLTLRRAYQREGKALANKKEWRFIAGCMLYWGEGFKSRNTAGIANTDVNLLRFFLRFLFSYFDVRKDEISLRIQSYTGPEESISDIEKYWLDNLNLKLSNLRKAQIDIRPKSSVHKGTGRKATHGICRITLNRTDVVQKIYGAIQEIGNFRKDSWVT